MNRLVYLLTGTAIFLSGCQSTTNETTVAKVNTPTLESKIAKAERYVENEDDDSVRFYLATLYTQSLDQAVRKKASPLLNELAKKNFKSSTEYLALQEVAGVLGYVSDKTYQENKDSFDQETLEAFIPSFEESGATLKYFKENFENFKRIYQATYQQCIQPIEGQLQSLEPTVIGLMNWNYTNRCLGRFSHTNSNNRFAALAKITQANCDYDNDNQKVCTAEGFQAINDANIKPENVKSLAYAVRKVQKDYDRFLKPAVGNDDRLYSTALGQKLTLAIKASKNNDYNLAISTLKPVLATPHLSKFDAAITNRFIGMMYAQRDQDGDLLTAIDHLSNSVNAKQLSTDNQYLTQKSLFDLYLLSDQYERYIKEVTAYISAHQKQLTILPSSFVKAVEQYGAAPTKVVEPAI